MYADTTSMIHTVSLADVVPQPWRNGGGSTQELLVWPAPDTWQVRISVALIEHDGPFSAYPGVTRWFAVIHGDGVALELADSRIVQRAGDPPLHFDGDAAPACALLHDATEDLNLMVRGESGRGVMQIVSAAVPWISAATLRAVYTADVATLSITDHGTTALPANTLAWSENSAHLAWHLGGMSAGASPRAWWMASEG
jgi:uncharacterized protein